MLFLIGTPAYHWDECVLLFFKSMQTTATVRASAEMPMMTWAADRGLCAI